MKKFALVLFLLAFLSTGVSFAKKADIKPPPIDLTIVKQVVKNNEMITNLGWEITSVETIETDGGKFISIFYSQDDREIAITSDVFRNLSDEANKKLLDELINTNKAALMNIKTNSRKENFKTFYGASSGGLPYSKQFHN